jgi:hypothetical protein
MRPFYILSILIGSFGLLTGCGGGSSTSSNSSNTTTVAGVATPSSVAVVTAQ